jgi:hypothetical protein
MKQNMDLNKTQPSIYQGIGIALRWRKLRRDE